MNERTLIGTQWQFRKNNVSIEGLRTADAGEVAYPAARTALKSMCLRGRMHPARPERGFTVSSPAARRRR